MSRYKIKSIEQVTPPIGATDNHWYKYVIANDLNTITSLRSGSKKEVQKIAADSIKRLNEKYLTHINFKIHKPVNEVNFSAYL